MVAPGQRLDQLYAKIKFLKIKVLLHFTIEICKLARKMKRDSVPKRVKECRDVTCMPAQETEKIKSALLGSLM